VRAYLGIGSNIGDMSAMLDRAVAGLGATRGIRVVARSADYRTPPWGKTDQPWFLNGALTVDTDFDPHGLLDACLAVEHTLGRIREERWGPRVIDIDVLAYEGAARTAAPPRARAGLRSGAVGRDRPRSRDRWRARCRCPCEARPKRD
jgi:2-amino-4-hydroxy-6-hydroxymethyldihydropteridine diphosphokinase